MATTQRTITTPPIRCGYVNWAEPRENEYNGNMEYSLQMYVPIDSDCGRDMEKAVEACMAAAFDDKGKKRPRRAHNPLVDAEDWHAEKGRTCPDFLKRHYQVNVKNTRRPQVIDRQRQELLDEREFQSGDFARVNLNMYAYDKGDGGVGCSLQHIQFIRKGEPLGGSSRATDVFDEWEDEDEDVFA